LPLVLWHWLVDLLSQNNKNKYHNLSFYALHVKYCVINLTKFQCSSVYSNLDMLPKEIAEKFK
jgi:hypothetical protein